MAFDFDISTIVDAIAALEGAITLPVPGIVNAYPYGNNEIEIVNTALPAIVHISRGPFHPNDAHHSRISLTSYELGFDIESLLLIVEAIDGGYPVDEGISAEWWLSIANVFFNKTNADSLKSIVGAKALSYECVFAASPSFAIRQWPPEPSGLHHYWSLAYTHRFTFTS